MKTTIYLVRHAEVENPQNIIYGALPGFGISKTGYFQAGELKNYFRDRKIDLIVSSPLLRAKQTARIIANKAIPIKLSKKFIEADFKNWDYMTFEERLKDPIYQKYAEDPLGTKMKGEQVEEVRSRVVKGITDLAQRYQGRNILVVSHGVPIVLAKLYLENQPLERLNNTYVDNASITKVVFNDKMKAANVETLKIVAAKRETS